MEYRHLGRSGLRVSKLCLGTMIGFRKKSRKQAARVVQTAVDLGVNFIDSADCYVESEEVLGGILAEGNLREKVVVTTKFGWYMGEGTNDYGASRYHIIKACEESLRKLRTDYIDLYVLHVVDPNTPLEEMLSTLDLLVREGKVRYLGTSKHPATLILEALAISERLGLERFVSEQPPYNLLDRMPENELVPACMRNGVGITPFSSLASGLLSGKYALDGASQKRGRMSKRTLGEDPIFTEAALEAVDRLRPIAQDRGITVAQLSLAWLMQQLGVTSTIVGTRTVEYVRSAVAACDIQLTDEELAKIDEIVPPGTYVSNFFEANVYRPLRMAYSSAARGITGTGAYIPDHNTGSDRSVGWAR